MKKDRLSRKKLLKQNKKQCCVSASSCATEVCEDDRATRAEAHNRAKKQKGN